MKTISVDINEKELPDLLNFKIKLCRGNEKDIQEYLEHYEKFTIYKSRMMGSHMVTVQIPIKDYLFLNKFNRVK